VDTPVLSHASVTDVHLHSLSTIINGHDRFYLQTSPEYAMKRLLAAGSGSIFQFAKAFRDDESGRHHNPEFTLLEWYRVGFDHHALMDEMADLLQLILDCPDPIRLTYQAAFQQHFDWNPHTIATEALRGAAERHVSNLDLNTLDHDTLLQLLMSAVVEPSFATDRPTFIYGYPQSQAALARLSSDPIPVAERFEVYWGKMELANGFHELTDATEQAGRFERDCAERLAADLPAVPIDARFLAALESGLPDCAGVALGMERVLMIALGKPHIDDVIAFPKNIA